MKKIALLLAGMMLFTTVFASCATEPNNDVDESTSDTSAITDTDTGADNTEDTAADDTEDTAADDTEDTAAKDTEDTAAKDTAADDTEDTAAKDTVADDTEDTVATDTEKTDDGDKEPAINTAGKMTDSGYYNDWLGVEFTSGKNIAFSEVDGYEMWAQDQTTGASLFIMIQELTDNEITDEKVILDILVAALKAELNTQVDAILYSEEFDAKLGTKSCRGFGYEMDLEGVSVVGFILVGTSDGYAISVNGTAADKEGLADLISHFEPKLDMPIDNIFPKVEAPSTYIPGETSENGYYSEWIGLEFIPTENMVMATEEELYSLFELSTDITGMDKELVDWAMITTVYEMSAVDVTTGSNAIVMAEKLAYKGITMDQYVEAFTSMFESTPDMSVTVSDISEITFLGETYTRVAVDTQSGGIAMKQFTLLRKVEDRMIAIIITEMNEGDEEALLACFKAK